MISAPQIQRLLVEAPRDENWLTVEILLPTLHAFSARNGHKLRDIRFAGGQDERGNDVEYYELSGPDGLRFYTGIQVKKGDINQSTATTLEMQARQAFNKSLTDPSSHQTYRVGRWVVACTGRISEPAKRILVDHAAREGRLIHFWDGLTLAQMILENNLKQFLEKIEAPRQVASSSNLNSIFYDPESPIRLAEGLGPGIVHRLSVQSCMPPTGVGVYLVLRPDASNIPGVTCHVRGGGKDAIVESLDTQIQLFFVSSTFDEGFELRLLNEDRKVDVFCKGYVFER